MKDEFSVESWMLHHCGVEGRSSSKKDDSVVRVCVVGRRVDRGR